MDQRQDPVGPVRNGQHTHIAVELLQPGFIGHTHGAMHLHRLGYRLFAGGRRIAFGHRRGAIGPFAIVHRVESRVAQQAAGDDGGLDIGQLLLHKLVAADIFTELLTHAGIFHRRVQSLLCQMHRRQSHQWAVAVPCQSQQPRCIPGRPQGIDRRNAAVVVKHLAQMPLPQTKAGDFARSQTGALALDNDAAQPGIAPLVLAVGAGGVDDIGNSGIADPNLGPVDHQLVAVGLDPRLHLTRVGAGIGLCRGGTTDLCAVENAREKEVFLFLRALGVDSCSGAFLRKDRNRYDRRQDLEHEPVVQHAQPGATVLFG